jgi:ferredoxin
MDKLCHQCGGPLPRNHREADPPDYDLCSLACMEAAHARLELLQWSKDQVVAEIQQREKDRQRRHSS